MLRRQRQVRTQIQKWVDASLFAFGFWLAHVLRSNWELEIFGGSKKIVAFDEYFWYFLLTIPLGLVLLSSQGFYDRPLIPSRRQTWWQLFKVCTFATIGIILVMFLRREILSRSVIILFGGISLFLLFIKEEIVRRWLEAKVDQGQLRRRLIVAGTEEDTARVRAKLEQKSHQDSEIVAELNMNDTSVEQLIELVHEHSANGIVLSAKHIYFGQIEKVIQACELEGVEVWLLADFFKTQISQTTLDEFYGRPMLVFRSVPGASWQSAAKQLLDTAGAFVLLVLFGPIILLPFALLIRLTSPGPILFKQSRSGLNGKPFIMYKFRSMTSDAEQRKHELAILNEMDGPVFKITNDPRVTPLGRFLRRYSIDEFPQLLNVLKGEMSLVGPRPLPEDEVRRFDDLAHRRRLSVKPGLTCLWQISGRNNVKNFKDWVRLDLEYIDNWSIWLDLKILLRTIPIVLSGTGAK